MYLGWRCYLGIPRYLDRGVAVHYHTPSRDVSEMAVLLGNPGILRQGYSCAPPLPYTIPGCTWDGGVTWESRDTYRQGYSYVHYHYHTPSRDVPGMAVLLGNPGILRQGYSYVHYHYHTPSRDVPGMAVLLGNPGILRQGYSCALPLPYTIPGCTWDGGVTWESRDLTYNKAYLH